jgi:hypothetical protein
MLHNADLVSIPERADAKIDPDFAQAQSGEFVTGDPAAACVRLLAVSTGVCEKPPTYHAGTGR